MSDLIGVLEVGVDIRTEVSIPHHHDNKSILDDIEVAYTEEEQNRIEDLELVTHTHSNKTILDAISASFTTTDEAKLDAIPPFTDLSTAQTLMYRDVNKTTDITGLDFTGEIYASERRTGWDLNTGTIVLGLQGGNVRLPIGEKMVMYAINKETVTIPIGKVVVMIGSQGNAPAVYLADANGTLPKTYAIGVTNEAILPNQRGFVTIQGLLRGLNTQAYEEGDFLYLSDVAGEFTKVIPSLPSKEVLVGVVTNKAGEGSGEIYVDIKRVQFAEETPIIDVGNYFTSINTEGALQETGLKIKGTYDDLPPVPLLLSKVSANTPTLEVFKGNIYQYTFDATNDEVFGATEITHQYKEGTSIYPHIHWASNGLEVTNRYVKWQLDYSIGKPHDSGFSNQVTLSTEDVIPANSFDRSHFITELSPISGTGITIGTYICWRLRRIASTGLAPTNNPFGLAVGFHVEQDTFGSATRSAK